MSYGSTHGRVERCSGLRGQLQHIRYIGLTPGRRRCSIRDRHRSGVLLSRKLLRDLLGRRFLALRGRWRGRGQTDGHLREGRHVLRYRSRRWSCYCAMLKRLCGLVRMHRCLPRGHGRRVHWLGVRLRGNHHWRARRIGRYMLRLLLRHWRHVAVWVVHWLPAGILLRVLLRVEGRRRAMVEGVGIGVNGRLRRRAVHVAMILLLAARLLMIGNGRGHGVAARDDVVIHAGAAMREPELCELQPGNAGV